MKYTFFALAMCCVLLSACKSTQTTTQNTPTVYDEDLTPYLTKYQAVTKTDKIKIEDKTTQETPIKVVNNNPTQQPSKSHNTQIDSLTEQLYTYSKNVKAVQGYRILVFSGADREEAQRIETDIIHNLQEKAEMSYDKPNFRVRVGHYIQRLEAYKTYAKIRKNYPNAIIILDKVSIESRRKR